MKTKRGLLASCALFPAMAAHQTEVRFTVTRHQPRADLELLLEAIAEILPRRSRAAAPAGRRSIASSG